MDGEKILYLITKSNFGGAQKYVYDLAMAAKQRGAEVVVAAGGTGQKSAKSGALLERLHQGQIATVYIRNFMRDMSLVRDIKAFFEVYNLIKQVRPTTLHLSSSKAGGIGVLAGRMLGIERVVFTSHGLTIDETWRPWWQRWCITLLTWWTVFLSHTTIVLSEQDKERLTSLPLLSKKVVVVANGIAPINFFEREEARKKLSPHTDQKSFWVGGIGELHPNKNWQAAIHALTQLPPTVQLFIAGEGEEYEQLDLLAKKLGVSERVHLLGYIDAVPRYLKAFDVFILPSVKEGLPYVILEAGAAALPVVASDLPGLQSLIETGEDGILIPPESRVLTVTLQMLIRDNGMRQRLGHSLQTKVVNNFSIEKMQSQTFRCYSSSVVNCDSTLVV